MNCIVLLPELLATGGSDGTVNIYNFDPSSIQYAHRQAIRLAPFYPLALSLYSTIDGILLAIGGSSSKIQLYASSPIELNFQKFATLKGHEDWIRGLDFTTSHSDIYLASGSQDRYIRLWKITQSTASNPLNDTDAL